MSENGENVENEFKKTKKMVHSTGFEPTTYCSGGNRSIQLSYECIQSIYTILSKMQMAKIKNWKILQKGKIRKYTEEYFSIKNFHPLYECFFYYPCTKCISGDIVYPITEILFEKVKN